MNLKFPPFSRRAIRAGVAMICALAIGPGDLLAYALPASASPQTDRSVLSADRLDSLVAPIALYPDPLLAQLLEASTHPAQLRQLDEWLEENAALSGHVLAEAVAREPWDPSVQAMAVFPAVVKNMTENIRWTRDLGDAVRGQESDVMDAVQRMRQRAQDAGYLSSNPQQVIERKLVDNRTVITIKPPTPQTVYVPYYNPSMIWGTPVYPWPQFFYAPRRGVWTGAAIGFGTGVAVGSFWGRRGWGWSPAWGWGRGRTFNRWGPHPARFGVAGRRGPRSRWVGTSGRSNVHRRNINRRNVNRRNVNRRNVNRRNANRRNVNRRNVNRGNRPRGTSGRSVRQARAGTANRANRPIGTAGRGNRGNRGGSRNVGGGGGRRGGGGRPAGGGGRRR
jgi:uncharacterized protein DUF3300